MKIFCFWVSGCGRRNFMERNTTLNEIKKQYEKNCHIYIYGAAGVGKTFVIRQFEEIMKKNRRTIIYMNMEDCDDVKKLERYLAEEKEEITTFILDSFEKLQNQRLLSHILKVMKSDEEKFKFIIISRYEPLEKIRMMKEKIKVFGGPWSFLNEKDIMEMGQQNSMKWSKTQVSQILGWSGGHPGIVTVLLHILKHNNVDFDMLTSHPIVIEYIENNIWKYLSKKQQQVCARMSYYPYICITCEKDRENYWIIDSMNKYGIIMKQESNLFRVPGFLIDFMIKKGIIEKDNHEIVERIGDAMRENGRIKNALECYYMSGNQVKHRECMEQIFDKLFWMVDSVTLKKYMKFSMQGNNGVEKIFLKGMLAVDDGNIEETKEALNKLQKLNAEVYLNLLYHVPEISVTEWMNRAEKICEKNGKIRIYSMNGGGTGCLGTVKDMSELFCHKKKEIDIYEEQWKRIIEKEQQEYFTLAKIEYLIDTNRMKEGAEQLKKFLIIDSHMESDKKEVLFGLMCGLYVRGFDMPGYEQLLEIYYNELIACESEVVKQNVISHKTLYDIWRKKDFSFDKICFEDSREDYYPINKQNCFYLINKAKYYLFLKQFEKAFMIFERLSDYFKRYRQHRYYVECSIGQAVAAYELNEETEAVKIFTVTMAAANQYRYVGIFCLYGSTAKKLIERYRETLMGDENTHNWKKKYYYGNVIGVSFENYLKVVISAVRKNAFLYPYNRENNVTGYENLTITENSILQYIEQGYSNEEIAKTMNIKLTTVKKHIYNIYKKLDVKSRVQAVQKGKLLGILTK